MIADHFTGLAYFNQLVENENDWNCPVGYVTFQPCSRNFWYRHPSGQILLVTEGHGWYQEWDQEAQSLNHGDVVKIPSGTKHWHGASNDSWLLISILKRIPIRVQLNGWKRSVKSIIQLFKID